MKALLINLTKSQPHSFAKGLTYNTLTVLCCLELIEYSEHELAGFLANPFQTKQVVDSDQRLSPNEASASLQVLPVFLWNIKRRHPGAMSGPLYVRRASLLFNIYEKLHKADG